MTTLLQVHIYENRELKYSDEFEGKLELGRQDAGEPGPFTKKYDKGRWRLIIAPGKEAVISRRHVLLEPLNGNRVRVQNGADVAPIKFLDRPDVPGKGEAEMPLPLMMMLGNKRVQVQAVSADLQSLRGVTRPPRVTGSSSSRFPALNQPGQPGVGLDSRELLEWLHSAMDVLQAAADSDDFFDRAAKAVVDMVDLDSCQVFLYRDGEWVSKAVQVAPRLGRGEARPPSSRVLNQVLKERRTFWEVPTAVGDSARESLMGLEAVVAAPVLSRTGEVIGALYGDRRAGMVPGMGGPISELEGMLVELLARGVAAGLARVDQEQAALAAQVQFEQFFTRDLARQLARHSDWLDGREAEVTVLFCDIRGFSRIAEKLEPTQTVELCKDVLDMLSDCVLNEGGVLVDYIGDGLMALWGAPDAQPDHAARACRAALKMMAGLPELNVKWGEKLKGKLDLGIGLNTGPATVGNVGSQFKFKYGARGNTVNLASRVEGATKHQKCRALITGTTQAKLDDKDFRTRRLGKVRVVGIVSPVELHELVAEDCRDWPAMKDRFETSLEQFEAMDFSQAARGLGAWRVEHQDDGPALVLLYRAVRYMVEGAPADHPVWALEGK